MNRLADVVRFYALLDQLERHVGGARTLAIFDRYRDWPQRGLYLFFEPSELRLESGHGPRIVRVGTHALSAGSRSTLRQRLGQHRGLASGGGNHRGSIFRLLIGQALLARGDVAPCASWGVKSNAGKAALALNISRDTLAAAEGPVESAVTKFISAMPFLWLNINDQARPESLRGIIERNAIALLSNYKRSAVDSSSPSWLGHYSDRPLVRESGLWNQRHVEETYDPTFFTVFQEMIEVLAGIAIWLDYDVACAYVVCWHKADIATCSTNVCFRGKADIPLPLRIRVIGAFAAAHTFAGVSGEPDA